MIMSLCNSHEHSVLQSIDYKEKFDADHYWA